MFIRDKGQGTRDKGKGKRKKMFVYYNIQYLIYFLKMCFWF